MCWLWSHDEDSIFGIPAVVPDKSFFFQTKTSNVNSLADVANNFCSNEHRLWQARDTENYNPG